MEISVIIPAFNEEKMIEETIKRVKKSVGVVEIVVVDDGSTDDTFSIAERTGVKCVRQKNQGKGAAFREGIKASGGDLVVQIDADSQFLPEEIGKLIQPIIDGKADVTLGSRFMPGAFVEEGSLSWRNYVGNYIDSFLTSIACGRRISDVQAGFKAFRKDCLLKIGFNENHFGYEPEVVILAVRLGYNVQDVPITYEKRRKGQSNIAFFRDALRITKSILRALFRRL
jgi:glycosyltransferase involved in cell wall biosynthesis